MQQEQLLLHIRQIAGDKMLHVPPVAINAPGVHGDYFVSSTHALSLGKQASFVVAAAVQETVLLAEGASTEAPIDVRISPISTHWGGFRNVIPEDPQLRYYGGPNRC